MDLKSGCMFWPQVDETIADYPPLDRDLACDVALVGGGITGALVSYFLCRAGVDCVILDRREIGHGSTAASTGLLQYELDTMLRELVDHVGKDHAVRAYQRCRAALDDFRDVVNDLGDDCGLTPRPSLYLATRRDEVDDLRDECELRQSAGIEVDFLSEADIARRYSFRRPAGLYSRAAMEVDPYRLTHQLLRRSVARGSLRVFAETEVARYDAACDADDVVLHTSRGPVVRARRVVFATGYETPAFLGGDLCTLHGTYAAVSSPLKDFEGWPERCLIWESDRPYFYLRTTRDGRAMLGGEDEPFADAGRRDALIPQKTVALQAKFRRMFPAIEAAEMVCAWAGVFAQTPDGLPYIGTHEKFPRGYFALGYGGNGITFSLIAGQILQDEFLGGRDRDAEIFRFGR
ncbi:MAG: NAD(P)/FAD-dependent oxidoreductase [Tepidisphaeraceae bacterium]